MPITQQQLENIQIDYGVVYINYGETDARLLGPTKGGGTFKVTKNIRDIEFDGRKGKTKGAQVVDEINAVLSVNNLNTSIDTLALAMPYATLAGDKTSLTCGSSAIGVVPSSAYLKNVTEFCKTVGGAYKKITIYNAMNEGDVEFAAAPKSEGTVAMEFNGHWDAVDDTANLYKIEDVANINGDTTKPTLTTTPADAATGFAITANLTALFSEDINSSDINTNNFILIKASDGTIVPGSISYSSATKTATFDPTASLTAATPYIWMIARVRDNAGNVMDPVVVNFTTA